MSVRMQQCLALLLSLCLLAGCAAPAADAPEEPVVTEPVQQPSEEQPQEEPQAFVLPYEPDAGFNPFSCTALTNRTLLSLVYEPLFTVSSDFRAAPYLVERYEVSGDGRTHTLTLREGAAFSDGSAVTAADAVASIQAARNGAYYGQRLRHIAAVTAASDTVLTISTDIACGTLDLLLNIPVVKAASASSDIPVGTGPYRLDQDRLTRVSWWRDAVPPVSQETIELLATASVTELRDRFEFGQVSLACTDPNAGQRVAYHSDFELWNNNTTILQYVGFNLASPVFVYEPIRAALTYAIDRDAIVADTAGGFAAAAVLPASPTSPFYDQKLADNYAYNPAAFQSALAASEIRDLSGNDGVLDLYTKDGTQALTGTMIVNGSPEQRVSAAQAVVDSLNGFGFSLTLKVLDAAEYTRALQNGNFDLYYGEVRLSPNFDLSPFFQEGGSLSYGGIADSAVELLCSQMLENGGNAYDLHDRIMARGLLCPVLFKTYAIYSARGMVANLSTCLDGVFLTPIPS